MWDLEFQQLLVVAMWDLVPWSGIEPGPPALGVWSLSHWTTKEVPPRAFLTSSFLFGLASGDTDKRLKGGVFMSPTPCLMWELRPIGCIFLPEVTVPVWGSTSHTSVFFQAWGNQNSHLSCPEVLHHPCGLPDHCSTFVICLFFFNWSIVDFKCYVSSHVWLFATPWTAAHQAPPSMGFSRQEYWSGVLLPSPLYLLLLLVYPSFPSLSPLVT